ncbi:MAG: malto-oligosyltrehalose trehalohydrolase [Bacillota bacterium]
MKGKTGLGATYLGKGRCLFLVWAPNVPFVSIKLLTGGERSVAMESIGGGYFYAGVDGVEPGSLYFYMLDGIGERPDPASRCQPEGVHGPSMVVDPGAFKWTDQCWYGVRQKDLIFYELHVGAYTAGGTFDDVKQHLDELKNLGITAIELMPSAQFPGSRNWGYDVAYPFAVQYSYGGPEGLRRLVDACHRKGLAVFMDVVYNHLGPEGNYLRDFGPYFTDRYKTPWGDAINFDGPYSDCVRRFFIENALYWLNEFHMDGLRLDAVHAITDRSAVHFLEELAGAVHERGEQLGRRVCVIAESDLNDPRLIRPVVMGGYGLDGQWNEDFHHAAFSLLTGDKDGYYMDYGTLEHMARAYGGGYAYTGQYSLYRDRSYGRKPLLCDAKQFVAYLQNHDQVGNRPCGERLSALAPYECLKLAAGLIILSPYLPLLFMGEEYGETAPFLYFTDHSDPGLVKAVRRGRKKEFEDFRREDCDDYDPQAESTFQRSKTDHNLMRGVSGNSLWKFYKLLIDLRKKVPALYDLDADKMTVTAFREKVLFIKRWSEGSRVCVIYSFSGSEEEIGLPVPMGRWAKRIDSADKCWLGRGSVIPETIESRGEVRLRLMPWACILLEHTGEV